MAEERSYRLAPGLEITRLPSGAYLLHSDFVAIEMGGDEAESFVERVLSKLKEPRTLDEIICELPGFARHSVVEQLERLRGEGVLSVEATVDPYEAAYEQIGMGATWTRERLATMRIAIFGLEAHGAYLAAFLADIGIRNLTLADPYSFDNAHRILVPFTDPGGDERSREAVAARSLAAAHPGLQVITAKTPLDAATVDRLVADVDLAIGCFDRGMVAAHHWINRSSLRAGVPALFSELRATGGLVGPLVIPGSSACFMCLRMRSIAAKTDFERVMAIEEHHDRCRAPALASRALLPGVSLQAAAMLAQEVVRAALRIQQPVLVDRVLEYDVLAGTQRTHPVLRVADCAVCGEKKKARTSAPLSQLLADTQPPGDPVAAVDSLVSERTGILTELAPVMLDPCEPPRPFVYRVHIANHQFLSDRHEERAVCSGKGSTPEAAIASALGEGIERYASARWSREEIVYARRADIEHETLDPRRLVLYANEQYAQLSYRPYTPESVLGWLPARSLVGGGTPWVPAIGVLMDYAVRDPSEYLFPITSNGLAAGSSLASAVLAATYEVLERDAFMLAWLHRWPGYSHDPATHPDPVVRDVAEAYRRRGVRLVLSRLPTDHPVAVFAAIALQEGGLGGPAAVVGLGADLDSLVAARKAALEVAQVRPSLRKRYRGECATRVEELIRDPTLVTSLEDHALLYTSPRHVNALAFLEGEPAMWSAPTEDARDAGRALSSVINHFRASGQDVLYVDLSSPELRALRLFCVRVIIPDFQPIWFGYREPRLGGDRVRELPVRLGFASAPVPLHALQQLPHPLA
jgi:ribosomal protein S12 methylthiotransferase accessory factor